MVKKILKDHKGLYACEPFNHGIQQSVSKKNGSSSKERKESLAAEQCDEVAYKRENEQVRTAHCHVFHDTN